MKVIIAGSRYINSIPMFEDAVKGSGFDITEVVSGGCRGVDEMGEEFARAMGIPCRIFMAQWKDYGKSAGPMRNHKMASYADALIAIWDGKSRGTKNMIETATKMGLKVFVKLYGVE